MNRRILQFLIFACYPTAALALGTAFTYQGRLSDSSTPANGEYDMEFKLFDTLTAGSQVGSTVILEDVIVNNGLFTVALDFGPAAFTGNDRWLEIGIRPGASTDPFAMLDARQPLRPAPTAIYSSSSGNVPWSGVSDKPAGFSDDIDDDSFAALSCATGQAPVWGGSGWTCSGSMPPSPGSADYIQNQIASAQPASLNISGDALLGGGLRLGVVGATCDASTEGTLRYDSTQKEVQFCNGANWRPLELMRPVLWSGGCSSHGTAADWNRYCTNAAEQNTAADHFSVNSNGTVTFSMAGFYRITFHTMSYGNGWGGIRFMRNGSVFYTGYGWVGYGAATWDYKQGDQISLFNVNDQLTVDALNPGAAGTGYAFYALTQEGFSRLQISYIGPP